MKVTLLAVAALMLASCTVHFQAAYKTPLGIKGEELYLQGDVGTHIQKPWIKPLPPLKPRVNIDHNDRL